VSEGSERLTVSLQPRVSAAGFKAFLDCLDYPQRGISLERDLHAFVLIGTVLEMHRHPVVELEHDESVVYDFTASDFRIHDVVETGVWPLALFPMGHQLAVTKEIHEGLDGETDGAERELKIELADPKLCRELPDNWRQVKLMGYPVHVRQSNYVYPAWHNVLDDRKVK
jgi:hypothetical protein